MTERPDRYPAVPADGVDARWATWDGQHVEEFSLRWENEGWTASGRVGREQIQYVVRLSPLWHVRQFLLFRDLPEPDLWLGTDGHGRWGEMNGAHRPELDGAREVALDVTPFTVSVPIRRIPMRIGDAVDVAQLLVDVETLAVRPVVSTYHRTGAHSWRVTRSAAGRDSSDLDSSGLDVSVDEYGLVTDVAGRFRRV